MISSCKLGSERKRKIAIFHLLKLISRLQPMMVELQCAERKYLVREHKVAQYSVYPVFFLIGKGVILQNHASFKQHEPANFAPVFLHLCIFSQFLLSHLM